jgi:hypothetical protein
VELLEASYADQTEKYTQHKKVDYAGDVRTGDYAEERQAAVWPHNRISLNYPLLNEGSRL